MNKKKLARLKLPDVPGVYFFVGDKGKILYIGKATSLRSRVRSYFSDDLIETRGPRIVDMVTIAKSVKYQKTDSVLEALLLEANLIKKHLPHYNIDQKDGKSWTYVVVTDETYPRLLLARGRELATGAATFRKWKRFGPFTSGGALREALNLIRKIFPFYDTKKPIDGRDKNTAAKVAFNRQIGLYPGEMDPKEYRETIRKIILLFEGKKKTLVRGLMKEMKATAKSHEFEKANILKRQIFALQHIRDVSLIKEEYKDPAGSYGTFRVEAYDVAHLGGSRTVGVMTVVEDGEKKHSDYRKFKISREQNDDVGSLKEVLERRLGHEDWPYPSLIVVDGGVGQVNIARKILQERKLSIPVVGVVKDEHHRPREIIGDREMKISKEKEALLANSEAHRFAITYLRKKVRKFHIDKS